VGGSIKTAHTQFVTFESLNRPAVPKPIDFGILTMKEEEYRAVERRFAPVEVVSTKSRTYLLSGVQTPAGHKTVLIARCLEQGQGAAQQCANDLLADADPRWLLLVGIAGAFPASEFTLGDVLLASRVHDFAITAALEGGKTEIASRGGPVHRLVAKLLSALPSAAVAQRLGEWNGPAALSMTKPKQKVPAVLSDPAYYGPESWKKKVRDGLKAQFPAKGEPRLPLYRTESVVTANILTKDTALPIRWKEVARQAAHVEMELGGVYEVAQAKDIPVLSIRGLSDVVGFVRSSAWTEYACQTAAAFARALVGSGLTELD
jgi:nucleoside phosphorylase